VSRDLARYIGILIDAARKQEPVDPTLLDRIERLLAEAARPVDPTRADVLARKSDIARLTMKLRQRGAVHLDRYSASRILATLEEADRIVTKGFAKEPSHV
jgi:hypothetical protein